VTLFASGDSRTSARLVPIVDRALWHREPPYKDLAAFWPIALGCLAERLGEFDVIHNHLDFWTYPLARLAPCPVVTTLHGRLDLPELQPLYRVFSDGPLVSISDAQRAPVPVANWATTIYHGIELDQFTFNPQPHGYLAFLGRISPEKGLDTAIRVAQRTGMPLKIAARKPLKFSRDPNVRQDWRHFNEVIQPLLTADGVEFVGEVGGRQKDAFLGGAAALLFPICWPEPFGLVMAEALACGTPVLALRHGSVPEVIRHGVTGYIGDSEDDLVDAVNRIGDIDRAACRAEAERRFSSGAMASEYERLYHRLVQRGDGTAPHLTGILAAGGITDHVAVR
jgi:glycosyltransferase involved in cell wall biosynthesis